MERNVYLVTGAASGIGQATAEKLVAAGRTVLAADIALDNATPVSVAEESSVGVRQELKLDVTLEADWQRALATTHSLGRWVGLVNCAGISISQPIGQLSLEQWRRVQQVNVEGPLLGMQQALIGMRSGGVIVNVASVAGKTPFAGASAYCASKSALRMLTKCFAMECADAKNQIKAHLVTPAGVKTPMWQKEDFFRELVEQCGSDEAAFTAMAGERPSMQFYEPEEVADVIVQLLIGEPNCLSGSEIVMDRGNSL